MQTFESILNVLGKCRVKVMGHLFSPILLRKGDGFLLQVSATIPNNHFSGEISEQKGGKYYISSHAIDEEIVGTLFKAVQDFLIHEAREGLTYQGVEIYGPHYPLNALMVMGSTTEYAVRDSYKVSNNVRETTN